MHYLTTKTGNLFIRAEANGKEIFFFMDKAGKHLNNERDFHKKEFYEQARKTWDSTENELPAGYRAHAEKIVKDYLDQCAVEEKFTVQKSPGNTFADALAKVKLDV
jgi:hypothetical protein